VAIYAEKAPNETAQLMKYAETIREQAKKVPGKAWLYYDEQFKHARQSMPISWAGLHMELYVKSCTLNTTVQPVNTGQPFWTDLSHLSGNGSHTRAQVTTGFCFRYKKAGMCDTRNCRYRDICQNWEKRHPASKCAVRQHPVAGNNIYNNKIHTSTN